MMKRAPLVQRDDSMVARLDRGRNTTSRGGGDDRGIWARDAPADRVGATCVVDSCEAA
jgi:hypothetical protein